MSTSKIDWRHATPDDLLRAACDAVGFVMCLSTDTIFRWAKRHKYTYKEVERLFTLTEKRPLVFCGAVLEGLTLEQVEEEMRMLPCGT